MRRGFHLVGFAGSLGTSRIPLTASSWLCRGEADSGRPSPSRLGSRDAAHVLRSLLPQPRQQNPAKWQKLFDCLTSLSPTFGALISAEPLLPWPRVHNTTKIETRRCGEERRRAEHSSGEEAPTATSNTHPAVLKASRVDGWKALHLTAIATAQK